MHALVYVGFFAGGILTGIFLAPKAESDAKAVESDIKVEATKVEKKL